MEAVIIILPLNILWEKNDGIWSNFAYALTVTNSRLKMLPVNFRKFTTKLWPLIIVRISFLLNNENKLKEWDQSLHMNWRWLDVDKEFYMSILQIYNNIIMTLGKCHFRFRSNSWGTNTRDSTTFCISVYVCVCVRGGGGRAGVYFFHIRPSVTFLFLRKGDICMLCT